MTGGRVLLPSGARRLTRHGRQAICDPAGEPCCEAAGIDVCAFAHWFVPLLIHHEYTVGCGTEVNVRSPLGYPFGRDPWLEWPRYWIGSVPGSDLTLAGHVSRSNVLLSAEQARAIALGQAESPTFEYCGYTNLPIVDPPLGVPLRVSFDHYPGYTRIWSWVHFGYRLVTRGCLQQTVFGPACRTVAQLCECIQNPPPDGPCWDPLAFPHLGSQFAHIRDQYWNVDQVEDPELGWICPPAWTDEWGVPITVLEVIPVPYRQEMEIILAGTLGAPYASAADVLLNPGAFISGRVRVRSAHDYYLSTVGGGGKAHSITGQCLIDWGAAGDCSGVGTMIEHHSPVEQDHPLAVIQMEPGDWRFKPKAGGYPLGTFRSTVSGVTDQFAHCNGGAEVRPPNLSGTPAGSYDIDSTYNDQQIAAIWF